MRRWRVESSMIIAISHDERTGAVELELHDGSIWLIRDVPAATVEQWLAAPSQGKFYHIWIKDFFTREVLRDTAGRELQLSA